MLKLFPNINTLAGNFSWVVRKIMTRGVISAFLLRTANAQNWIFQLSPRLERHKTLGINKIFMHLKWRWKVWRREISTISASHVDDFPTMFTIVVRRFPFLRRSRFPFRARILLSIYTRIKLFHDHYEFVFRLSASRTKRAARAQSPR